MRELENHVNLRFPGENNENHKKTIEFHVITTKIIKI